MNIDLLFALQSLPSILTMLPVTLFMLAVSVVFGMTLAFATALSRVYRVPVIQKISKGYVSFIRSTPYIIQLFIIYYVIPSALRRWGININTLSKMTFVIISFIVSSGAFFSETLRGALESVDPSQIECARSIGMTGFQAFFHIRLPQSLKLALPSFGNTTISMLKDTALAFNIGVIDIMGRAKTIGNVSYRFFEVYLAAAAIYWGTSIVLGLVFESLEFYLDKEGRAGRNPVFQRGFPWRLFHKAGKKCRL
jgi:His/Glu/Gln/Arg/opine family amino acid ABC transporter permease subunit